jgi:alkylation response protein AidB-like acyl-CoA dehydrogenase
VPAAAGPDGEPVDELRRLVGNGTLAAVPLPGQGRTRQRFGLLADVAAIDLSRARLVEGHLDALAILAEAGATSQPGCYGVWAAERPGGAVRAEPAGIGQGGRWRLSGVKPYASGAGHLDRALVTAMAGDGPRLFDVDLHRGGSTTVSGTWPAVGMAGSLSGSVRFDDVVVEHAEAVGPPGFYTARPGFWAGSAGVAACWYGGARGIVAALRDTFRHARDHGVEPPLHQLAHLGAAVVRDRAMAGALGATAAAIDADPQDRSGRGRARALTLRHLVYEGCLEVLDRAARAGRTSLLTGDPSVARRFADLPVYLSQHHPDDDLAVLGLDALTQPEGRSGPCTPFGPATGLGRVPDPAPGAGR